MKLNYYPETDSLYIDLSEQSSVETREIGIRVGSGEGGCEPQEAWRPLR